MAVQSVGRFSTHSFYIERLNLFESRYGPFECIRQPSRSSAATALMLNWNRREDRKYNKVNRPFQAWLTLYTG